MRKHFLILMLLSLLPLAGFAVTDISSDPKVSMATGNVVFGGEDAPAIQLLYDGYEMQSPQDYTFNGKYYTTSACTTEAGAINELEVGTYYVKVEGAGVYTGTRVASFDVTKADVTVPLIQNLTKVYGAADPALTDANIDWENAEGFVGDDDKSKFSGTLTYSYDNGNVGVHTITVTGYTAKNYTLKVTGGLTITAKAITAAMITAVELSEIYKGAAFDEFAVDIKNGSTPLVAGTDFVLKAYTTDDLDVEAEPTNVGTYYLGISEKDGANYSVAATTLVGTFEITQAGLTVRALNQTKVYTGIKTLPDATTLGVAYQLIGVQGEDEFAAPTLTVSGDGTVGAKTITPSYDAENPNYDYNYVDGTLTITQRGLTITALDAKKVYKKNENTVTKMDGTAKDAIGYGGVTIEPTLAEDEEWEVPAADITKMKSTATATGNGQLKVTRPNQATDVNKGDYEGALVVSYNEDAAIWDNYDVTLVDGDFHIIGGKIYITALHQSKNYGQADPDWTAVEEKDGVQGFNYRVDGLSAPDVVTGVTLTCDHEEAVGDYAINIAATGVPTGYEDIVFVPGTFSIKKRPLAVTARPQTLKVGDDAGDLDQTAFDILSEDANEGLIDGDLASEVFSLTIDEDVIATPLAAAAVKRNAIIKVDGDKAGNYNITFVKGKLIVIDPAMTIVLNRPNKAAFEANPASDDAAAVIATAAAAKYTVAQANAYNAELDDAVEVGDETGENYDEAGAAAHNAELGAVSAGDPVLYDAETAATYNGNLVQVAEDDPTPDDYEAVVGEAADGETLSAEEAEAYNTAREVAAGDPVLYDAETAATYNGNLDQVAEDDPTPDDYEAVVGEAADGETLSAEEAEAYNTAREVAAGDPVLYTEETAATYNAGLVGLVQAGDPILYTAETAAAYNAELEGSITTDDQRPFAVTFGDFNMVAEKWYPIVLPFETSVKEVSEAFGYAIVNILKQENTDATKIAFKLHMGDIPANEPFVVKVYQNINMNEVFFAYDPENPYNGKLIENSDAPEVEDDAHVKFIGSYSHKIGFQENEAFFSASAERNDYYWGPSNTYMAPLGAYFQIPEGSTARTIEFQEADGSTTAIEVVTNSNEIKNAEGWYTINGMKLESAPVEKGVYINNGKKIVIK